MSHPVTVIIPTYGRASLLGRTLESLTACQLPASYRETIVIENGPASGAATLVADLASAHPALRLRYMHTEAANKSNALNEAAATATEGLLVLFDDDVRLAAGILVAYANVASGYEQKAFFGGPMGVDYEEPPPEWLRPFLPFSVVGVEFDGRPRPIHYLGCNWALFTSDLRDLGGFSPDRGPGSPLGALGQEAEIQHRMRHAGFERVDVPDARVWHYVPRDRCTPEWALNRTYKAGLQKGTRERAAVHRARPLWIAEYAARGGLAMARWMRSTVLRDPVGQFDARARLRKHMGTLVGYVSPQG